MFDEDQQKTPVKGLTVATAVLGIQVIDRALSRGIIAGSEVAPVAETRTALHEAIERAVNVNYDATMQKLMQQAQQQAAQRAQAQPVETGVETSEAE